DSIPSAILSPIIRVDRNQHLPLSYAQQQLWFLTQMGAGQAYHSSLGLRLQGRLNREALQCALQRIVARQEILRTTFTVIDSEPVQRIIPVEQVGFRLLDHDLRDRANVKSELRQLVEKELTDAFNLEERPPIRGRLIHLTQEEHALLLTMH